jgi:nucleoside-diphosphate-sugar epimerase
MILVTGATGLVGAYLVLQLAEKEAVVSALYRTEKSIAKTRALFLMHEKEHLFSKINWILADITDIPALEIAFENIKYVYHCAAKISFDPRDQGQLRKINIEGTANIVNFCLAKNVRKICCVSSIAALGDLADHNHKERNKDNSRIIDEEADWNPEKPHSDYAISKYGAEMEIWRGQQEGLKVIIVNPGVILGSIPKTWNRKQGSFRIITAVANGLKHYTRGSTGFVGVCDVVTSMIQLMNSTAAGNRYILVSENLSYKNILHLIADNLNVEPPKKEAKRWMTQLAWRWDWVKTYLFLHERNFTKAIAKSVHTKDVYSNQKVKSTVNFEFETIASVLKKIAEKY